MKELLYQTSKGVFLHVKIIPNSSENRIIGWENQVLKIKLTAIPEKGKANKELIHFLSRFLKIRKSKIEIVQGESNAYKKICLQDVFLEEIQEKLNTF
jgi:uncharacterized protein (TIGR00251 family)